MVTSETVQVDATEELNSSQEEKETETEVTITEESNDSTVLESSIADMNSSMEVNATVTAADLNDSEFQSSLEVHSRDSALSIM